LLPDASKTPRTRPARALALAAGVACLALAPAAMAQDGGGGVGFDGGLNPGEQPGTATLDPATGRATAPTNAPPAIRLAIKAGNHIRNKPYKWGGGHGKWADSGYDCSGTVSYLLHKGGFLDTPKDSGQLRKFGKKGQGSWITVMANRGHTYIVVAGLRMDTSGSGGSGPRWQSSDVFTETNGPFKVRHPRGGY
jgi:hypothetical protein